MSRRRGGSVSSQASGCRTPFFAAKCEGTIEDHREIALDVRELIRKHVFDRPVGSVFRLQHRFPWLRMMRLNSSSLDLELVTGRTVMCRWFGQAAASWVSGCGWSARSVVGASARSTISTQELRVGTAMAFGMPHSGPAALRESFDETKNPPEARRLWPNLERQARRSRAACGGGHKRGIVRRWPDRTHVVIHAALIKRSARH